MRGCIIAGCATMCQQQEDSFSNPRAYVYTVEISSLWRFLYEFSSWTSTTMFNFNTTDWLCIYVDHLLTWTVRTLDDGKKWEATFVYVYKIQYARTWSFLLLFQQSSTLHFHHSRNASPWLSHASRASRDGAGGNAWRWWQVFQGPPSTASGMLSTTQVTPWQSLMHWLWRKKSRMGYCQLRCSHLHWMLRSTPQFQSTGTLTKENASKLVTVHAVVVSLTFYYPFFPFLLKTVFECSKSHNGSLVARTSVGHVGRWKWTAPFLFPSSRYERHGGNTIQDKGGTILSRTSWQTCIHSQGVGWIPRPWSLSTTVSATISTTSQSLKDHAMQWQQMYPSMCESRYWYRGHVKLQETRVSFHMAAKIERRRLLLVKRPCHVRFDTVWLEPSNKLPRAWSQIIFADTCKQIDPLLRE